MLPVITCYFCQQLPVLDKSRTGKETRCPLCKSVLLAGENGTTYRHPTEEEKLNQPKGFFRWFRKTEAPVQNN